MSNKKGPPDYRSAKTGQFVKEDYAKKHPSTTEKEHNRPPSKPTNTPSAPKGKNRVKMSSS